MFSNFLYFIVVLLIYATYMPSDTTNFSPGETTALFFSFIFFFVAMTRFLFRRIEKRIGFENPVLLDHRFTATQLRLSVLSVLVFALDIYTLNIIDFLEGIPILGHLPTFQAAVCILLFTTYLTIVWHASYTVYRRLNPSPPSRAGYVLSNISFAVPVLIPWFILSALIDILYALPSVFLKSILSSAAGEICCVLLFLVAVVVTGPALIQKFWRCKSLPPGPIRSRIESICRKAGVPYRDIVEWPVFGGRMITAGVLGLVKRFRYILVTRALLSHLSPEELDAVIAHEAAHVKKKHLLFYLFFLTGYMLVAFPAIDMIIYLSLFSKPAYSLIAAAGFRPSEAVTFLRSAFLVLSVLIYFRYIFGYFMRNFERQADAYAFSMFGTAAALVTTFKKIAYTSGQSPDKPSWHHFSLRQRIDFLESCEWDRGRIAAHDRKVRRSIAVFLVSLILIGGVGYQLKFGDTGKKISKHLLQNILELEEENLHREIENDPGNAELIALLGDLYFNRKDFQSTINAYEHALSITFDSPHVLNNLAWLYATCEVESLRNPDRALLLARRAAELDPSPETLDTLGESYFINGEYEKAVEAGKKTLELAESNREYYEEQLKKFETATRANKGSHPMPK